MNRYTILLVLTFLIISIITVQARSYLSRINDFNVLNENINNEYSEITNKLSKNDQPQKYHGKINRSMVDFKNNPTKKLLKKDQTNSLQYGSPMSYLPIQFMRNSKTSYRPASRYLYDSEKIRNQAKNLNYELGLFRIDEEQAKTLSEANDIEEEEEFLEDYNPFERINFLTANSEDEDLVEVSQDDSNTPQFVNTTSGIGLLNLLEFRNKFVEAVKNLNKKTELIDTLEKEKRAYENEIDSLVVAYVTGKHRTQELDFEIHDTKDRIKRLEKIQNNLQKSLNAIDFEIDGVEEALKDDPSQLDESVLPDKIRPLIQNRQKIDEKITVSRQKLKELANQQASLEKKSAEENEDFKLVLNEIVPKIINLKGLIFDLEGKISKEIAKENEIVQEVFELRTILSADIFLAHGLSNKVSVLKAQNKKVEKTHTLGMSINRQNDYNLNDMNSNDINEGLKKLAMLSRSNGHFADGTNSIGIENLIKKQKNPLEKPIQIESTRKNLKEENTEEKNTPIHSRKNEIIQIKKDLEVKIENLLKVIPKKIQEFEILKEESVLDDVKLNSINEQEANEINSLRQEISKFIDEKEEIEEELNLLDEKSESSQNMEDTLVLTAENTLTEKDPIDQSHSNKIDKKMTQSFDKIQYNYKKTEENLKLFYESIINKINQLYSHNSATFESKVQDYDQKIMGRFNDVEALVQASFQNLEKIANEKYSKFKQEIDSIADGIKREVKIREKESLENLRANYDKALSNLESKFNDQKSNLEESAKKFLETQQKTTENEAASSLKKELSNGSLQKAFELALKIIKNYSQSIHDKKD